MMLKRHDLIAMLTFALSGLALTACGSAGGSLNLPQDQGAPLFTSNGVRMPKLGGNYAGTVTDSLFGSGRVYAELVQYRHAVGGNFTFTYGSTEIGTPHVFLLEGTTLTGTGETATLSLNPCTVSETATHDGQNLNGSYTAVRGCSGDNGSFAMQEYCRYVTNSGAPAGPALKTCGSAGALRKRASQPQAAPSSIAGDTSTPNLNGEFSGTVSDSIFGSGNAHAELVQYQDAVGGSTLFEYGSTVFIDPSVYLLKGSTLTGTAEGATLTGVPCAMSETVKYHNQRLSGSYQAVNGCSGESGTFTMKEVCRYVSNPATEPRFAIKQCYSL